MRKPPYAGAAISEQQIADGVGYKVYTPSAAAVQVSLPSRIRDAADAAARIKLYRQDLDRWHGRPPGCRMPQGPDYGLAMACCSSADVLFGGAA